MTNNYLRPLVIDEDAKEKISGLKKYAFDHKFDKVILKKISIGKSPPCGDDPNFTIKLFEGFRIAFSIEEHPCGWMRHISISVDAKNKCPSIASVKVLIKLFDFKNNIRESFTYLENNEAVNVLEKISEDVFSKNQDS